MEFCFLFYSTFLLHTKILKYFELYWGVSQVHLHAVPPGRGPNNTLGSRLTDLCKTHLSRAGSCSRYKKYYALMGMSISPDGPLTAIGTARGEGLYGSSPRRNAASCKLWSSSRCKMNIHNTNSRCTHSGLATHLGKGVGVARRSKGTGLRMDVRDKRH